MVRYDSAGKIQWMNSAARRALGTARDVVAALVSGRQLPAMASLPLGNDWLWLGSTRPTPLDERARRVNRLLNETYRRRSLRNLDLLRAQLALDSRLWHNAAGEAVRSLEQERGRIARELHDNAGQALAGILLNLELAQRHLGSASAEATARLARSQELASLTLDQIRRISHDLNPPDWSNLDFSAAVEWLVESMGVRGKLVVEIEDIDAADDAPPEVKTTLYRTLQEALTNVLKHASASRITIRARSAPGGIGLVVEDDGRGFDPAALQSASAGIGLTNLRRRVKSLGGKLELSGTPGHGARLSAFVPAPSPAPVSARAAGAAS